MHSELEVQLERQFYANFDKYFHIAIINCKNLRIINRLKEFLCHVIF